MDINELVIELKNPVKGNYDQPCAHGYTVPGHAVYCHNNTSPEAPIKCRRTWYSDGKDRDEDCPGFTTNTEYKAKENQNV